jgi:hypothetical protein
MSSATNGRAREHRVTRFMEACGWSLAMRAAGSKGAADLAMVHAEHGLAWCQVGTANKRLGPADRERLVTLAELSCALPLLITTAPGVRPKAYVVTRDVPSRWQPWPLIQTTDPLRVSGSSLSGET